MAIDRAAGLKKRIVDYLQDRYRKTGVNSPVSWRTIWIELGVAEHDFSNALQEAADDIVTVDADHVKLARRRLN